MNAKVRRKLEMSARALLFCREHPDSSEGYAATLSRLENCVARGRALSLQQHSAATDLRQAAALKRTLRGTIRRVHIAHLARVARIAAHDLPELRHKFRLRRGTIPYLEFRAVARSMLTAARSRRQLLVDHGLSDTVLDSLVRELEQFDEALALGERARLAQVGASAELQKVASEGVKLVKVMEGTNRLRFAREPDLLAAWMSASHVMAAPQAAEGEDESKAA